MYIVHKLLPCLVKKPFDLDLDDAKTTTSEAASHGVVRGLPQGLLLSSEQ
jgi:hypothetical protein